MESFSIKPTLTRTGAPAFTLVEMLVVLAIIAIITVIVLTGQSAFSRTLLLTDTAYTVALSLREAQTYGISSHVFVNGQSYNSNTGYGIDVTPNAQSYTEFADTYPGGIGIQGSAYCPGHSETNVNMPDARPGDCVYESGYDGVARVYTFGQGYSIGAINGVTSSGATVSPAPTAVDITFQRPNTTSVIVATVNGVPTTLQRVDIQVDSPQGGSQCVVVNQIGVIAVQETCSP